jgi:hypothetical protein
MFFSRKLSQAAATWFNRYSPATQNLSHRIKSIEFVGDVVLISYVGYLLYKAVVGKDLSYKKMHLMGCPETLVAQDFDFQNIVNNQKK